MNGMLFKQVWRFFWRDVRSGELTLIFIALVLAVASLSTVHFFIDRIEDSLNQQARQFLAADMVVSGGHFLFSNHDRLLRRLNVNHAKTVTFPSMAFSEYSGHIVTVKAVSDGYPLRGTLETWVAGEKRGTDRAPEMGTVWADERFLTRLKVREGERVQIGKVSFRVAAQIMHEPDAALDLLNTMPRVMMNLNDLPRTGLIQEGSRARFRLLLSGSDEAILSANKVFSKALKTGERIENIHDARPEFRSGLVRAQQFLNLTGLLTLVFAAVALSLAARRYGVRHESVVAVLRCLGATQGIVLRIFLGQCVLLGVCASLIGTAIGFGGQFILFSLFHSWLGELAHVGTTWRPWIFGVLSGMLLLLSFFLPMLIQLRGRSVMSVLRQERAPDSMTVMVFLCGMLGVLGVTWWHLGDVRLMLWVCVGVLVFFVLALMASWTSWRMVAMLVSPLPFMFRQGVHHVLRRPLLNSVQTVVLSLGVLTMLTLLFVQRDILQNWANTVPLNAPNRFLLNVQPLQAEQLDKIFSRHSLESPLWYPVIRGRWLAKNGELIVSSRDFPDEQLRQLAEREFNLTWREQLPEGNKIVEGAWWGEQALPEFSVEHSLAERLGIRLGDTLTFDVGGESFSAKVTSFREVNWTSFRVNFLIIASPNLFKKLPSSLISSFYLPVEEELLLMNILRDFPNITMVDIGSLLSELREILNQVIVSLRYLLSFGLIAGIFVLWISLYTTRAERLKDAGLLRMLGASSFKIFVMYLIELLCLGMISGSLGGMGAMAVLYLLSTYLLELNWVMDWAVLYWGMLLGVGVALCVGLPMLLNVTRVAPLKVLRNEFV